MLQFHLCVLLSLSGFSATAVQGGAEGEKEGNEVGM